MKNTKKLRRGAALLLAWVMLAWLLPGAALAQGGDARIEVSFTLLGSAADGADGTVNTLVDGNLTTWIAKTGYTVPAGATAGEVFAAALADNGFTEVGADAGYVTAITDASGVTLASGDNGESSGWLFQVNGEYPADGMNECALASGDELVWHWTDDYMREFPEPAAAFADIDGHWAQDAIEHICGLGLMNGVGGDEFDPDGALSRAMLVTVLYRIALEPEVTAVSPFSDVAEGMWYSDAVIWAAENGIVSGCGGALFCPEREITREQIAVMLCGYADLRGCDVSAAMGMAGYEDAADVSDWAVSAMTWAVSSRLITGRGDGTLDPGGDATRAEAAAILARFVASLSE